METIQDFITYADNIGKVNYDRLVALAKETSEALKKVAEKYDTYDALLHDEKAVKEVKHILEDHIENEQLTLADNNDAFELLVTIEEDDYFKE